VQSIEDVSATGDRTGEHPDDIARRSSGRVGGVVLIPLSDIGDSPAHVPHSYDPVRDYAGAAGGVADADDLADLEMLGFGRRDSTTRSPVRITGAIDPDSTDMTGCPKTVYSPSRAKCEATATTKATEATITMITVTVVDRTLQ
jgi:hypothetical protein